MDMADLVAERHAIETPQLGQHAITAVKQSPSQAPTESCGDLARCPIALDLYLVEIVP